MPRNNRDRRKRKDEEPEELRIDQLRGFRTTVVKRGVEYTVQSTNGVSEDREKTWVCPHCHITIQQGTPHTVAWDAHRGVDGRRHFHNACWRSFQGPLL